MDKYKKLASNTIIFAIGTFSSKILSFLLMPFVTRMMTTGSYGAADLIQQTGNVIIPIAFLCVNSAALRFSMDKAERKSDVFTVGVRVTLVGFLAFLLFAYPISLIKINDFKLGDYLVLIYVFVLTSGFRQLCQQFVRGSGHVKLFAIDGILATVTYLLFTMLFLGVFKWGVTGYILAIVASDFCSVLFFTVTAKLYRYVRLKGVRRQTGRDMLRYCLPMIPASISFWIINASDMFFVQGMCEGYAGRSGNHWVGLLSAGDFLPQIITILGSIFYEAWQLSAVTEETDREAFFSKIFRVYASVLFCCVAGIIMLCQLLMRVFKAEYFDAWTFVPFLTLCSMLTCLNQFLNSVYVVYKRSTGSLFTMLAGAVLNLILNYCFIRLWGPWGVTLASFLSLMLVFLLRAYSTRGLLEIDFHPAWLVLNLALVLAEIWCMMKLTHWALPVVGITAVICVMNIREVLSMLDTLIGKFLKKKKA
mgnify:CR=1 FL=1